MSRRAGPGSDGENGSAQCQNSASRGDFGGDEGGRVKAPRTAEQLNDLLDSINSREDGAEALSLKLDLMLRILLEIRNNLRGY
jgi:hypothetical protein